MGVGWLVCGWWGVKCRGVGGMVCVGGCGVDGWLVVGGLAGWWSVDCWLAGGRLTCGWLWVGWVAGGRVTVGRGWCGCVRFGSGVCASRVLFTAACVLFSTSAVSSRASHVDL